MEKMGTRRKQVSFLNFYDRITKIQKRIPEEGKIRASMPCETKRSHVPGSYREGSAIHFAIFNALVDASVSMTNCFKIFKASVTLAMAVMIV